MTFYVRPHHLKTIEQMDKLRGTKSKSEFLLESLQYMIDTHQKNKDILTPIDLPTLAAVSYTHLTLPTILRV